MNFGGKKGGASHCAACGGKRAMLVVQVGKRKLHYHAACAPGAAEHATRLAMGTNHAALPPDTIESRFEPFAPVRHGEALRRAPE